MISVPVIENSYMLAHGTRAAAMPRSTSAPRCSTQPMVSTGEPDAGGGAALRPRRRAGAGGAATRVAMLPPPEADADAGAAARGLVGHRRASLERRARSSAKATKATA